MHFMNHEQALTRHEMYKGVWAEQESEFCSASWPGKQILHCATRLVSAGLRHFHRWFLSVARSDPARSTKLTRELRDCAGTNKSSRVSQDIRMKSRQGRTYLQEGRKKATRNALEQQTRVNNSEDDLTEVMSSTERKFWHELNDLKSVGVFFIKSSCFADF